MSEILSIPAPDGHAASAAPSPAFSASLQPGTPGSLGVLLRAELERTGLLLLRYPVRMALLPFIADIGSLLPELVSGAVIVSQVMALPTTGPMLLQALRSQDMYLAGSFLMFLAVLTVIGVLLSDLALAALDPRIRLGGGATK